MKDIKIKQIDAFSTEPFSGNPACIVLDADILTDMDIRKITDEFSQYESAFITTPNSANAMFKIRYLTSTSEMDISGHTTVAACFALIEEGRVELAEGTSGVILETNIGDIPVDIHFAWDRPEGDEHVNLKINGKSGYLKKIMTHQSIMDHREADLPIKEIADILQIDEGEIAGTGLPMEIIYTGLTQLVIPINHRETLLSMHPDLIKLSLLNQKFGIETNDIFTLETSNPDSTAYSRHFSPVLGTWENPASGNGGASVGSYLLRHGVVSEGHMVMEQGKDIDKLARVYVEIDQSDGVKVPVQVGGLAVTSIEREIQIDREDGELVMR